MASGSSGSVTLTWSDPSDVTYHERPIVSWAGTLVIRKTGSAPTDKDDGTVVVNNTTRNQYSSTGYTDTGLTNGTTYYYGFFPYSTNGDYASSLAVSATPKIINITIPSFSGDTTFTYDTLTHTPGVYNPDEQYIEMDSNSVTSSSETGTHQIIFRLKDPDTTQWNDGTTVDKTLTWSIVGVKKNAAVSISTSEILLTPVNNTATIPIAQIGDGTLSVVVEGDSVITTYIYESNLIITLIEGSEGNCTVQVHAAPSDTYYGAASQTISVACADARIMTVKIDQSDSNLATCCTYADDAVNLTVGSDDWDKFFGHYPCLFKDGKEVVKLNPNDFTKDINGNSVDITSGNAGDVMIAFPRCGLRISTSGNIITVSMINSPNNPNFEYMAHKRGSTLKDKFYIGAYVGTIQADKLHSLSGKTIARGRTNSDWRDLARANGGSPGNGESGYDMYSWYHHVYIQAMYLLKYKNLNPQNAVGMGWVNAGSFGTTGNTNNKGMDYGTTSGNVQMKLFGIEDLWGQVWVWVDGFYVDASLRICTATENFNSSGSGYTAHGTTKSMPNSRAVTKVMGTTHDGFMTKDDSGGSYSTYYCDYGYLTASKLLHTGGSYDMGAGTGIFFVHANRGNTSTEAASRLMYL